MNTKRFPILALLLMAPLPALAIVNVENLRVESDEEGWSGSLSLSASATTGNTETEDWRSGFHVQNKRGPRRDFVIATYHYGESSGIRSVDSAMIHGRHVQEYAPRHAWEAFVQWERDEFRRLSDRELAGAGHRWRLQGVEWATRVHLGLGAFFEHEQLDASGTSPASVNETLRGNIYISAELPLSKTARLVSTTYFQPSLEESADRRALEQAALRVDINESLAVNMSLDVTYDSDPPANVESTDITYTTGIEVVF